VLDVAIDGIDPADHDPFTDLVLAFDPHYATDGLGTLATDFDAVLAPTGLGIGLDQLIDGFISLFPE
jgi:hypothetical protein